jgi:hypothetical protein
MKRAGSIFSLFCKLAMLAAAFSISFVLAREKGGTQ